jgi:hypothetical protein
VARVAESRGIKRAQPSRVRPRSHLARLVPTRRGFSSFARDKEKRACDTARRYARSYMAAAAEAAAAAAEEAGAATSCTRRRKSCGTVMPAPGATNIPKGEKEPRQRSRSSVAGLSRTGAGGRGEVASTRGGGAEGKGKGRAKVEHRRAGRRSPALHLNLAAAVN